MADKPTTNYMSTIKVGPKGQVVIPKEVRDMFNIEPGDSLVLMADSQRGIAIHKQSVMEQIAKKIFEGAGQTVYPNETNEDLANLANAIRETGEKGVSIK